MTIVRYWKNSVLFCIFRVLEINLGVLEMNSGVLEMNSGVLEIESTTLIDALKLTQEKPLNDFFKK